MKIYETCAQHHYILLKYNTSTLMRSCFTVQTILVLFKTFFTNQHFQGYIRFFYSGNLQSCIMFQVVQYTFFTVQDHRHIEDQTTNHCIYSKIQTQHEKHWVYSGTNIHEKYCIYTSIHTLHEKCSYKQVYTPYMRNIVYFQIYTLYMRNTVCIQVYTPYMRNTVCIQVYSPNMRNIVYIQAYSPYMRNIVYIQVYTPYMRNIVSSSIHTLHHGLK